MLLKVRHLEMVWIRGGKDPVFRIEIFRETLDCYPKSLRSHLLSRDHSFPVPDHGIHHHVEDFGVCWFPLGGPLVSFECDAAVAPCLDHHE